MAGTLKRMLKGEQLFREGEMSNAMYLIRTGMIRIYKKKGDSQIEIDTLRAGQIIGEMAFLDGNPRSASAEAIIDTELIEISQAVYQQTILTIPDWLKILLKAIVARLRSTTTRLKNLEMASTQVDYTDGSKRVFVFLSSHDALKIATAFLLVGSRNCEQTPQGNKLPMTSVERYCNQIMGIPVAKMTSFAEVLKDVHILDITDKHDVFIKDLTTLEQFIHYLADENQLEPSKRHDISVKGFLVMSLIAKNLAKYPKDPNSKLSTVNIAEVRKTENLTAGKEVFRLEDFNELVKLGYGTALKVLSADEQLSMIQPESFILSLKMQRIIKHIEALNEQKQKAALGMS